MRGLIEDGRMIIECMENDVTKLERPLRREIEIGAKRYTLTIEPQGLKLKLKGHRRGLDLRWLSLAERIDEPRNAPVAQIG